MKQLVERVVKWVAALLMLPAIYVAGTVLWHEVESVPFFIGGGEHFAQGVFVYLAMHALLWEPIWIYVMGHELTHAICGLLFFARITGFKVSRSGGSVTLSKSNFFISLGPYLIPIYTLVMCLAFLGVRTTGFGYLFVDTFLATVGFTWAMHLVMTVKFIRMKQPDLVQTGQFFSLALIAFVNVLVLAAILSWAVPGLGFLAYLKEAGLGIRLSYEALFTQLFL